MTYGKVLAMFVLMGLHELSEYMISSESYSGEAHDFEEPVCALCGDEVEWSENFFHELVAKIDQEPK